MSRSRLRTALATRSADSPAIAPLLEAHAARLEQLSDDRWPVDAEAQARMLRSAQALYDLDAVTVGGGGLIAATACWLARTPALGGAGARAAVAAGQALGAMPSTAAVADAPPVHLARDVLRRLRAVLGDRAGIAVVLPSPARLLEQLGVSGETSWATDVSMELLRAIGGDEPDVFLVAGDEPLDPTLESLGDFFGAPVLTVGASSLPGIVTTSIADAAAGRAPTPGWLHTTRAEIDPASDPATLRAAFARLRA